MVVKFGLMVLLTASGMAGGLVYAPFIPVALYHFFAVLRPQFMWSDSVTAFVPADFPWSMLLAVSAIVAALVWRVSFWVAPHRFPGVVLPRLNIGHVLFGTFALWITATYFNAGRPDVAEPFFADYRKLFIMFFVTALVMVTVRQVGALYLLITLALVYIAFEVNEIYLLNNRYNFIYRRGFCGLDNNGAALLLAMGVPLCIYAWDGVRHWTRWLFPIGALIIVHAVLLSYSRGAMLSLAVTSPLYLWRCQNRRLILLGYVAAAALTPVLASEQISERFFTISKAEKDASAQNRFTTWDIAWKMANERPLFGYGVRNSSLHTHKYGADEEGRVIHSTYLQIAADSGLVGLGAYLAFLGGAFYCAARVCRQTRREIGLAPAASETCTARRAYTIACGAEGALAVFVVGGAFLSLETFEPPYIVAMLAIQLWSIVQVQRSETVVVAEDV